MRTSSQRRTMPFSYPVLIVRIVQSGIMHSKYFLKPIFTQMRISGDKYPRIQIQKSKTFLIKNSRRLTRRGETQTLSLHLPIVNKRKVWRNQTLLWVVLQSKRGCLLCHNKKKNLSLTDWTLWINQKGASFNNLLKNLQNLAVKDPIK